MANGRMEENPNRKSLLKDVSNYISNSASFSNNSPTSVFKEAQIMGLYWFKANMDWTKGNYV